MSPALTLATLLEIFLRGLGPPLQIRSAELTLVMGWEEGLAMENSDDRGLEMVRDLRHRIPGDGGSPISVP